MYFTEVGHDTGDKRKHATDINLQCYNEEKIFKKMCHL